MHFSTHQKLLIEKIQAALMRPKKEIIQDFKEILSTARFLYKTDQFDFWLKTLESVPEAEIPMTTYGLSEAIGSSTYLHEHDRNRIVNSISGICESVFTYVNEDEMCELFGLFHFYCLKESGAVFKISQMGVLEGIKSLELNSYRIAYTSELDVGEGELYR